MRKTRPPRLPPEIGDLACARQPITRPDAMFWPDQVLKDAVAMLADGRLLYAVKDIKVTLGGCGA